MALLDDQIEEAQSAFVAAHDAGDTEGAQVLADHLRDLQAQKVAVDTAAQESSQSGTNIKNPIIAGGVGALVGATVNPARGAVHNIITPPAAPPKMNAPAPSSLSSQLGQGGENWTKSLTGVDVPNAQMNKGSLDTAQRMADTVGRGGPLAGGTITEGGIMLPPEIGAKPAAPAPVPPRTIGTQTKQASKSLLQGIASEPQPTSPFSIVKGGARGAITGATLADVPQQLSQGNYGTAASDVGVAAGNIAHGIAKTPKGKAIGTLLGLGSGVLRGYQGIKELTSGPEEQKATGGLVHLAEGGQPDTGAYIGYPQINRNRQEGYGTGYLNTLATAIDPTGLTAAIPEANASILSETPKEQSYREGKEAAQPIAEVLANLQMLNFGKQIAKPIIKHGAAKAGKLFNQARNLNVPQGMAGGGDVVKAGVNLAKKAFTPKQTQVLRASEALGPHEGKWLNITQSDRMRSTDGDLGGPGFSKFQGERPEYSEAQAAWGVGNQPTASRIINVNKKFPEGQSIWTPMIGSETQHHSNQHVYDALTEEFNRQVAAGKLPPELRQRINQKLATAANKEGKPIFQEGADIANPEHLQSMGSTFERRGNVANLLAGNTVGGQKGRIIDYPGIMQEMTDPMTVGAPTHALGTRLFTLNNQIENRPDLHSAFPYILKGEDQGVAFAPVPKELGIQDWINQFREFKGREPGFMDLTRNAPSQQVTDKYLRSLEAAGHAAGGKIGTAKKLFEEAQAAYKAKFTPGFYHGSGANNIKAFDPLKNTDPMKLETPGVTFATRDPDFAESFLPGSNRGGYKAGATMYPVNVNLGKHWHPNQPESQQVVQDYLAKMYPYEANPKDLTDIKKQMLQANWTDIENPNFMQHLRDTGHDTFHVMEGGIPNVGVFEPQNIRGKFAKFNPENAADPDFMRAAGGSVEGYAPGGQVLGGLAKFLEGSKIPQRLYHGTTVAEENGAKALSQLKQSKEGALGSGIYMTPNTEFSNMYANQPGGYVMPVHTNLKNPLEIHSTQGGADPMKMALMQLGVPEAKAEQIIEKAYDTRGYVGKEVMSRAQKQGYDGLAQYHDGNLSEVVSYNPASVKSATGNTGEFNPYDPRLSKKAGGKV